MNELETIEKTILHYPIFEYCFGRLEEITFSERIREICERDCPHYGKSWACPPYTGSPKEAEERCRSYESYCLFSTVSDRDSTWDGEDALHVKMQHEKITGEIRRELTSALSDCLFLSSGCAACEVCSCPDAPCRFPERRISPIESHGIMALELAQKKGLSLACDDDTIVYFTLILFHEAVHADQNQ